MSGFLKQLLSVIAQWNKVSQSIRSSRRGNCQYFLKRMNRRRFSCCHRILPVPCDAALYANDKELPYLPHSQSGYSLMRIGFSSTSTIPLLWFRPFTAKMVQVPATHPLKKSLRP
ncbi:hypothetical protein TNCV_1809911 [Trichonephila clavipes]|nr:hypothetical protein TNCV_1809911 [Trichonephila clavipes]